MTQPPVAGGGEPEDRRRHLDYIQAGVTRMSQASSTTKSWLLPVITAAYGFAITKKIGSIALLGVAAVLLFALLDANYLRQEQAFRRLYDAVARRTRRVPVYSLDLSQAQDPLPPPANARERVARLVALWVPGRRVWSSWSIAPFYGGLVVIGVVVFIVS